MTPRFVASLMLGSTFVMISGCRVSSPGRGEISVAQWVKRNVTVGGAQDRNPLKDTRETENSGREAFGYYCTVCHGLDGQNTGVPFAANLYPPVPSLASKEVQRYSDGQLKWVISNGVSPSGMPASRGILSDEEMWSIVIYLRHLPPAGSLGDPPAYSGGSDNK